MVIGPSASSGSTVTYFSSACPSCDTATPNEDPKSTGSPQQLQGTKTSETELSDEEKQQVAELKQRDRDVRAHEAAHMAAGGGYVRGGATFSYQSGPDGKRYAVGGEVSIDTSSVKDNPQATIQKMQSVRGAALAPASPSGQDRSVASAATSKMAQARQELNQQRAAEQNGDGEKKAAVSSPHGYDEKGNNRSETAPQQVDMTV